MSAADDKRDEETGSDEDLGFLQRWSRRKQAAVRAEPEDSLPAEPEADEPSEGVDADEGEAAQVTAETAADVEPEPPSDEDMPPLESIDQGGSVAAFFSPRVSAGLRRAALRRLFAQPEFSGEDLLDDYARDYTKRAPLGDIVTADMRYRAEQARKLAERKLKAALEADEAAESRPALAQASESEHSELPPDETAGTETSAERETDTPARLAGDDTRSPEEASPDAPDKESKPT
jgi:hypothetical protein